MKVFFNFLKVENEISENPMKIVAQIKPKRKQKELSPEELKLMLGACDVTLFHKYRTWIQLRLILDTGIRATECCLLMPEDIDFRTKSILVKNAKNGHERYVFLVIKCLST